MKNYKYQTGKVLVLDNNMSPYYVYFYLTHILCMVFHNKSYQCAYFSPIFNNDLYQ